jgi:hypothetical protein
VGSETEVSAGRPQQRCGGRQPAGSPRDPSGRFDPRLQPAGATKALGLGLGRGDEQLEWGAARAARWSARGRS